MDTDTDTGTYDEALAKRRTLLKTPCGLCGVGSGWCVDAGGHDIRNLYRQHAIRYSLARVHKALLRALFAVATEPAA